MQAVQQTPKHELVAGCLRKGLHGGRWSGSLPGVLQFGEGIQCSAHGPARVRQLEAEGVLGGRGLGRSRGITAPGRPGVPTPAARGHPALRRTLTDGPQTSMVLVEIMHSLEAAGHAFLLQKIPNRAQARCPPHDPPTGETPADAWVVESGSRPLLEWCATQPTPCLALYGRTGDLPLARTGPYTAPAYRAATSHCLRSHRRIVVIAREARRKPTPGMSERAILEELTAHGVLTGDYHLPDWEETPAGFSRLLENLFKSTPPTALIIDETPLIAAMGFSPGTASSAGTSLAGFHRLRCLARLVPSGLRPYAMGQRAHRAPRGALG